MISDIISSNCESKAAKFRTHLLVSFLYILQKKREFTKKTKQKRAVPGSVLSVGAVESNWTNSAFPRLLFIQNLSGVKGNFIRGYIMQMLNRLMSSTIMLEKTIETLYQREFSDFHYIFEKKKFYWKYTWIQYLLRISIYWTWFFEVF